MSGDHAALSGQQVFVFLGIGEVGDLSNRLLLTDHRWYVP